jgi:Cu/Ag efflux pump CusA
MKTETVEGILKDIQGQLPAEVQSWIVETGPDSTGDDAVWVWAILRDEDVEQPATRTNIREKVWEEVRKASSKSIDDSAPWVYVHFRGASEVVE